MRSKLLQTLMKAGVALCTCTSSGGDEHCFYEIAQIATNTTTSDVAVRGNLAFTGGRAPGSSLGLFVINTADPSSPVVEHIIIPAHPLTGQPFPGANVKVAITEAHVVFGGTVGTDDYLYAARLDNLEGPLGVAAIDRSVTLAARGETVWAGGFDYLAEINVPLMFLTDGDGIPYSSPESIISTSFDAKDIVPDGDELLVATSDGVLRYNPASGLDSLTENRSESMALDTRGNLLVKEISSIALYDISGPGSPLLLDTFGQLAQGIEVAGDVAFVASNQSAARLIVYDISDPTDVTGIGSLGSDPDGDGGSGRALALQDGYVYLVDWAAGPNSEGGLTIVDARACLTAGPCNPADLADPLGLLDLADVNTFASAFIAGDPLADIDGSTLLDLGDINLFVTAFNAGCP